jgi:hypothetical protein
LLDELQILRQKIASIVSIFWALNYLAIHKVLRGPLELLFTMFLGSLG